MVRLRTTLLTIFFIALIPIIGFGIMRLMVYVMPVWHANLWVRLFFTLIIIALGLIIPYWILKLGFHYAHLRNSQEKEFEMKDMPKDKGELAHDKK